MRLAEVWMDGYKRLFYTHRRDLVVSLVRDERPHQKTKQSAYSKTKAQISFAVTAKLISAFVFATQIEKFLCFLNPKLPASSHFLCMYTSVCVESVWKPHCWFSHDMAQMVSSNSFALSNH